MKYIVKSQGAEHLFPNNDKGFSAAVELAVASKVNVYIDDTPRKLVWKYAGNKKPHR